MLLLAAVLPLPADVTIEQARDRVLATAAERGAEVVSESKYQIVMVDDLSRERPISSAFMVALVGDPRGGKLARRTLVAFIPGEPQRVRVCGSVQQSNRFGGSAIDASDCNVTLEQYLAAYKSVQELRP